MCIRDSIKAMGLERRKVYISNICKFRPAMDNQGSGNRKPTAEEMRACVPFVLTEIDLIKPLVIVALGATAAEGLGIPGTVGGLRGKFHSTGGIPTMVTYHPSYLLREEQTGDGIRAKRAVWEDMLKVMEKLGLPISAKPVSYTHLDVYKRQELKNDGTLVEENDLCLLYPSRCV